MLGLEPRASCMIDKSFTSRATLVSPVLPFQLLKISFSEFIFGPNIRPFVKNCPLAVYKGSLCLSMQATSQGQMSYSITCYLILGLCLSPSLEVDVWSGWPASEPLGLACLHLLLPMLLAYLLRGCLRSTLNPLKWIPRS